MAVEALVLARGWEGARGRRQDRLPEPRCAGPGRQGHDLGRHDRLGHAHHLRPGLDLRVDQPRDHRRAQARQPGQERVPGAHEPRDPHPDDGDPGLCRDARGGQAQHRAARTPGHDPAQRRAPDRGHQRHPRPVPGRGGQARARDGPDPAGPDRARGGADGAARGRARGLQLHIDVAERQGHDPLRRDAPAPC